MDEEDEAVRRLTVLLFQEQAQQPNDQITFHQLEHSGFHTLAKRLVRRGVRVKEG